MKFLGKIWVYILSVLVILVAGCVNDERALVVGKIQQANDLVTSEVVIDKVVFGKKTRKVFFVPINEASFLAYSQARVKTGIDLNSVSAEDIKIEGTTITLQLPPIEVINFSYPPESFMEDTLVSQPNRFLNNIRLEDQEEFFRQAEMDIRESLPFMGLVKSGQEHTRKLMHTLLKSLGFKEIYITFKSDDLLIPQVIIQDEPDSIQKP
ncbi:DUF4230 domain-containing protein [Lunatibacter salilacus]|uniref:DUF4230 domain-containing protein n=1 Tax=Lunatibacter salilacus TaxID=2483804 RepID=UPI00131C5383|nr:DUF4230 domain-containing protein [Lunatibacter salilacus]